MKVDFAAVFDASPNPYMLVDRDLRYVAVNKAYCDATHRSPEQLIGTSLIQEFPHDPDSPNNTQTRRLTDSLRGVFETGKSDVLSLIHYRIAIDGAYQDMYWSATHTPVLGADGRVEYVLQHTVNVTELQRNRTTNLQIEAAILDRAASGEIRTAALDRSLRDLVSVFDQAPGFLAITRGKDHVFELANPGYRRLVGRDVVGKSVREVLPEIETYFMGLLDRVYETGTPFVGESLAVTLANESGENTQVFVDFVYQPISDGHGKTTGILVSGYDVTKRVLAERAREAAARVLGETRDFVGIASLDGTPTYVNEAALQLVGFDDAEAAKRIHFTDYFVERQRARVRDEVVPAAMQTGYWQGELAFVHQQTGEEIPVWYTIFPVRDGAGAINGLATITRDLRPQKQAEAERAALLEAERAARAQAERATILMDQFLATVSHELRTPLSAILGWTQMLRTGTLGPEKHERALETVERNAQIQAHLVDDLLDVSRIITGKLTMELEQMDLAAAVAAAVDTVRPTAQAKGVRLDVDIDASGTTVHGDSARLQQVVWNLLSNAVKFTPAGGRVVLRVANRGGLVELRVSDTGIGIPADFLPHVFDRFRQADGSSTRRRGGLGLGLSIVHHVVEAHGGTVTAESAGLNQGATFTVRIPTVRARTFRTVPPPTASTISLKGMKILVVDDEDDTREFVRNLLEQNAASVITVASAADAVDALQRERPDLLLSDLGMPEEDGFSLIRRVRALPTDRGGRTPAVALTAYARSEDRTRAMLAGFQNHVSKPVVANELLAVLASLRS